jgi:hypothetical protein
VYEPPLIDDIWEITIEQAVRPPALRTAAGYLPITWRGKVMENVSAIEAIQCAIEYFHEHRKNQQALLIGRLTNRHYSVVSILDVVI